MLKTPFQARVHYGQPYMEAALPAQVLDLYIPEGDNPFPLVVWIHGGGWFMGSRRIDFAQFFLERGLALASLGYRLTSSGHPFPAQSEDCVAALDWLKKNGPSYGCNVERIGVVGHSAGAHLSALFATAGEGNPHAGSDSAVQAAVLWSGPFDLGRERGEWASTYFPWNPKDPFGRLFFPGGVYDEEFGQWASPSSYVKEGMPPLLILHGDKDNIVPLGQARVFAERAEEKGAKVLFRSYPEGNHDMVNEETLNEAADFFQRILSVK